MSVAETTAPVTGPTYAREAYWDARYSEQPTTFDWFYTYPALRALICGALVRKDLPCLHIGCGNSTLQEGLASDGYNVCNIDISGVVIDQMRQRDLTCSKLEYAVADCRSMPEFKQGAFGACIDKGTYDAVLCSGTGAVDSVRYIQEVYRILTGEGVFLLISLGEPSYRIRTLSAAFPWAVSVALLPKPTTYLHNEAAIIGRVLSPKTADCQVEKDQPLPYQGPYTIAELEEVMKTIDSRDFFYAYICVKTLPQA